MDEFEFSEWIETVARMNWEVRRDSTQCRSCRKFGLLTDSGLCDPCDAELTLRVRVAPIAA